jgi:hypothetical protein
MHSISKYGVKGCKTKLHYAENASAIIHFISSGNFGFSQDSHHRTSWAVLICYSFALPLDFVLVFFDKTIERPSSLKFTLACRVIFV